MEIVDQLPRFVELINKAGVIGLLLIVLAVLVWEVKRLRRELSKVYLSREKWKNGFLVCKAALDFNKIPVDLSQMKDDDDLAKDSS